MAAQAWPSNADLVLDLVKLNYLRADWLTLDPTYGDGKWWTKWSPELLVCHDLYKLDGVDFCNLPETDNTFDAIAFDPPYVCPGGRKTSTTKDFHGRYGMSDDQFRTPDELQQLINRGLGEMARVIKPQGIVLVKCMSYISSGKLFTGVYNTLNEAFALGFRLEDQFEHLSGTGPQSQKRQVHARRNHSTLLVLKAAR